MATQKEVKERLCALATKVRDQEFGSTFPSDCFCGGNGSDDFNFQFSENILKFIELAVNEKLNDSAVEDDRRAKGT